MVKSHRVVFGPWAMIGSDLNATHVVFKHTASHGRSDSIQSKTSSI